MRIEMQMLLNEFIASGETISVMAEILEEISNAKQHTDSKERWQHFGFPNYAQQEADRADEAFNRAQRLLMEHGYHQNAKAML